jgi:carbamoylphosphate synthase small subunit
MSRFDSNLIVPTPSESVAKQEHTKIDEITEISEIKDIDTQDLTNTIIENPSMIEELVQDMTCEEYKWLVEENERRQLRQQLLDLEDMFERTSETEQI